MVSGEECGFLAVSYFGVDRQGTDTLISTKELDEQLKTLYDLGVCDDQSGGHRGVLSEKAAASG